MIQFIDSSIRVLIPARIRFFAALALIHAALAFGGCSRPNVPSGEATAGAAPEGRDHTIRTTRISDPMPASIRATYNDAERAFAAADADDPSSGMTAFAALEDSLARIRMDLEPITSVQDFRAGLVTSKEDLIEDDIHSAADAVRAGDRSAAKRECNRLTKHIAELAGMYASAAPSELMMLKYYNREIDIAASRNDRDLLKQTADNVRKTWMGLRPAVEARGGIAEARSFNDLVTSLERSGPPGQVGAVMHARVSAIEQVLTR
jgi:hypothetical protein